MIKEYFVNIKLKNKNVLQNNRFHIKGKTGLVCARQQCVYRAEGERERESVGEGADAPYAEKLH